jgi:alpha-galactosidase
LITSYCPGGRWNGGSGFIKELYARPDWKQDMEKMASGETKISLERSHEYGSQIIHAAQGGATAVIHGNVENTGLIDNLPQGACVEVPIYVDRNGLQPMRVGDIPMANAAINQTQINVQRLAVDAVLTRDPERIFQAFAMDPLTAACLTLDEIRAMSREIMEAQRFCLPDWDGIEIPDKPVLVDVQADDVEKHVDPAEEHVAGQ